MAASGSTRLLRSMVADLARLGDDDLQAILDELDGASRQRLTGLLHDYQQGETVVSTSSPIPAGAVLSDWLIDRLSDADSTAGRGLTPAARQALRKAALEHGWSAPPSPPRSAGLRHALAARIGWNR